jgi:hypothetical protein
MHPLALFNIPYQLFDMLMFTDDIKDWSDNSFMAYCVGSLYLECKKISKLYFLFYYLLVLKVLSSHLNLGRNISEILKPLKWFYALLVRLSY